MKSRISWAMMILSVVLGAVGAAGQARLRVPPREQERKLVRKALPVYPEKALRYKIQGTVRLGAVISTDGRARLLWVISGHLLLISAALEAVKQWVWRPTLLRGEPVEVLTQIDVQFRLGPSGKPLREKETPEKTRIAGRTLSRGSVS